MKSLSSFIEPRSRYSRSVNLERDRELTVEGYIPTARSLEALERLLTAMTDPARPRAWSITGPYGSGKSSFVQFLSGLLGPRANSPYTSAYKTLKDVRPDLLGFLRRARNRFGVNDRGVICAVATAQREPIARTLGRALLCGARNYWNHGRVPSSVAQFETLSGGRASRLKPDVVSRFLEDLAARAPVLLAIDEMGKSFEYAADHSSDEDLFLLQQVAERVSGEGGLRGMLVTLQHLAFADYSLGMRSAKRKEWAKVQGRFEDIPFVDTPEQTIKVIASVMRSDNPPRGFRKTLNTWAAEFSGALDQLGLQAAIPAKRDDLGKAFPLHPLTLGVLPELCARYGQHDRSLFTFLTSDEPHSVKSFLRSHTSEPPLLSVGLDQVYEYFVGSVGVVAGMGSDTSRWLEIESRLREATDLTPYEARALKIIAVLNLVSAGGQLRASRPILEFALEGANPKAANRRRVDDALKRLGSRGFVTYRSYADEFRLWQGSDFDIGEALKNERERLANSSLVDRLSTIGLSPLIAQRHSFQHGVLRFFESRYAEALTAEEFTTTDPSADGLVLYLLGSTTDLNQVPSTTRDGRPLVVACISDPSELEDAALEAAATVNLLSRAPQGQADPVARRELRQRSARAQEVLRSKVDEVLRPGSPNIRWVVRGEQAHLKSGFTLSQLLSELLDEFFSESPTLHNDMLNRRVLTTQGAKARRELIEAMILKEDQAQLGIDGYGPDRSMYESVLNVTGIHRPASDGQTMCFGSPKKRSGLATPWKAIEEFFNESVTRSQKISSLYHRLASPPFGMKEGPIPVLLTAALLARADDIAIYQDGTFQPRLSADLMERMVKSPERFSVKHFSVKGVRRSVFVRLADALEATPIQTAGLRNTSMLGVVKPLLSFFRSLSEYSLQTSRISEAAQRVRTAMVSSREPDELLFKNLPEALGIDEFSPGSGGRDEEVKEFCESLEKALGELRGSYEVLLRDVTTLLMQAFASGGSEENVREDLRARARHLMGQVIDRRLRSFVNMAVNEDLEDREWLEALAMNVAQKPVRTWTDQDLSRFEVNVGELARIFRRVELLHYEAIENSNPRGLEAKRISVTSLNGSEVGEVVWVEPVDQGTSALIERLLSHIDEHLGAEKRKAVLAVLAEKLLASESEEEETNPEAHKTSREKQYG